MLPILAENARRQLGVFTRAQALAAGHTDDEVRAFLRSREWWRVRHGAYVASEPDDERVAHLRLCWATLLVSDPGSGIGGPSAAVVHGIDQVDVPSEVNVVGKHARTARGIRVVRRSVDDVDLVEVQGLSVTTAALAVVDSAMLLPFAEAVVIADSALHRGRTTKDEMSAVAETTRAHAGARRVIEFADGRSESVGESLARVALHAAGVPRPDLQQDLQGASGRWYRGDFYWRTHRLIGEFDGKLKYHDDGRSLWDEKRREDDLRAAGYDFVRFGTADVHRVAELGRQVRAKMSSRRASA